MSESDRSNELTERVQRLETKVYVQGEQLRELREIVAGARPRSETFASPVESIPTARPAQAFEMPETAQPEAAAGRRFEERAESIRERFEGVLRAEWLFTRGGILLLLLGVAFLFKLAVDEGWITPAIRVAFGLGLGAAMIALGLRVYKRRIAVGQVLLGGGIAAFYASGFAAYTLYALIPAYVAFPFMLAVTVAAFVLSLRRDAMSVAIIGVSGGLATPFLLYSDEGSVIGLTFYTALVFSGAAAIYLNRNWRSVMIVASSGALLALFAGGTSLPYDFAGISAEKMTFVGGMVFVWLVAWFAPIFLLYRNGAESPVRPGNFLVAAITLPITAFSLVQAAIEIPSPDPGFVWLGMAAAHGLVWYALRRAETFRDGEIVYAQAAAGIALGTLAVVQLLDGWTLVLVLAVEATLLHLLSSRYRDLLSQISGHAVFVVLGLWLAFDISERTLDFLGSQDSTAVNWVVWLTVLALGLVSSFLLGVRNSAVYKVAVHVGLLGWVLAVLAPLENGGVWTTVAWGLYGVALIVCALRLDVKLAFRIGLGTLLLVVAKLFLVDLFWVEALWRVALFIGFGGLFIALGYIVQSVWRPGAEARTENSGS